MNIGGSLIHIENNTVIYSVQQTLMAYYVIGRIKIHNTKPPECVDIIYRTS